MTQPARHDLKCYKGQTFRQNIYFRQNGEPIDLTGVTAKADIRPSENSKKLTADFDITVHGAEGKISLMLSAENTAKIAPGFYHWDLKLVDSREIVDYWIAGKFIVTGRVTE